MNSNNPWRRDVKVTLAIPFAIIFLISLALPGFQQGSAAPVSIHYVSTDGNCAAATPCYTTIQEAIDASAGGDEIRIAAGSYTDINTVGSLKQVAYITKSLTLKGGYTISDWETQAPVTNLTVLNAQTLGRVMYILGPDVTVSLDGLTLSYGKANGFAGGPYGGDAGGGLYVSNATLSMNRCTIDHGTITTTNSTGAGLYATSSTLHLVESSVLTNTSVTGAGIRLFGSTSTLEAVTVQDNHVTAIGAYGPGLYATDSSATTIINSHFLDNESNNIGSPASGAIHVSGGSAWIQGTIVENTLKSNGVILNSVNATVLDCLVRYNGKAGDSLGGGITISNGITSILHNTIQNNYSTGISLSLGNTGSSAIVQGNLIQGNVTDTPTPGGGVWLHTSGQPILFLNNIVEDNQSGSSGVLPYGKGGGIYIDGDKVVVRNNLIRRNIAHCTDCAGYGGYGGGLYILGDSTLENNIISDNQADSNGGGVKVVASAPALYHTTLSGNVPDGLYANENSGGTPAAPLLFNTIIANQTSGLYVDGEPLSTAFLESTLWWNNTANITGDGTVFETYSLSGDPAFVDIPGDDYHLTSASAALDGCHTGYLGFDIDHQPRPPAPGCDLGADQYWAPGELWNLFLTLLINN